MTRLKICSAMLILAIAVLFVPASNAQSIPVVAVGSSALFPSAAIAAVNGDPVRGVTAPLCGSRFWTNPSAVAVTASDARSPLTSPIIPVEGGTLWVAWDSDSAPTIICTYLSVDSIVGQRLFFGQGTGVNAGNGVLNIPTSACNTGGGNRIAYVWDTATTGLPFKVWNALQGGNSAGTGGASHTDCSDNTNTLTPVHFNVAFTDIRPEDAQFLGNNRVLCSDGTATANYPADAKVCLGYGPGVSAPGTAVVSSFSTASAQAVAYSFVGSDPISTVAIPASQTFTIGAEAIIPIVNTIDASTAGFGTLTSNGTLTNVLSHTLAAVYSGQAILTRDVVGGSPFALPARAVNALQREPMSGTYTTFEYQVIRQNDASNALSQESGICGPSQGGSCTGQAPPGSFAQSATAFPTVAANNPLSACAAGTCGLRTRVIGTGQMVSVANTAFSTTNSILGYAFWSLGSFGGKANIKYLQLDGHDGLFASYSANNGAFPGVVTGQGSVAFSAGLNAPGTGQCAGYFNGDGTTISKFTCNAYNLPTFANIQTGVYRAWNILRGVYYGSSAQAPTFSPLNIAGFVASAQDQANPSNPVGQLVPDFYPTQICNNAACGSPTKLLNVFRAHYASSLWSIGFANNGIAGGSVENGGDVAGAAFNNQTEDDLSSIFGSSLNPYVQ